MTIWLDRHPYGEDGPRGYTFVSHMIADTEEEMHEFARTVMRFPRSYCHISDIWGFELPHYDLTEGMRTKAIRNGAQHLEWIEFRDKAKAMQADMVRKHEAAAIAAAQETVSEQGDT